MSNQPSLSLALDDWLRGLFYGGVGGFAGFLLGAFIATIGALSPSPPAWVAWLPWVSTLGGVAFGFLGGVARDIGL